jgi:signal peptidase II
MVTRVEAKPSPGVRAAAFARAGLVLAGVLGLDQLTKHTIAAGIDPGQTHRFLPGIDLVHVRNKGVAFGFLSGGGTIVLAFTVLALAALVTFLWLRPMRPGLWVPTGLLLGGALGNLLDRVTSGAVTDFIKLPHWPAFNLADIAITLGVLSLLWVLEGPRKDGR